MYTTKCCLSAKKLLSHARKTQISSISQHRVKQELLLEVKTATEQFLHKKATILLHV